MKVCVATVDGVKVAKGCLSNPPYYLVYEYSNGWWLLRGRVDTQGVGGEDEVARVLSGAGCDYVLVASCNSKTDAVKVIVVEEGLHVWDALRLLARRLGLRTVF